MESQMSSLPSSHVLSVLVHYLDQLYRTPLGETPRYKMHVTILYFTKYFMTPVKIKCNAVLLSCLACLLHIIINIDSCVVVARTTV